jgi:hypothetical protein
MPRHFLAFPVQHAEDFTKLDRLTKRSGDVLFDPARQLERRATHKASAVRTHDGDSSNERLRESTLYLYFAPEFTAKCWASNWPLTVVSQNLVSLPVFCRQLCLQCTHSLECPALEERDLSSSRFALIRLKDDICDPSTIVYDVNNLPAFVNSV